MGGDSIGRASEAEITARGDAVVRQCVDRPLKIAMGGFRQTLMGEPPSSPADRALAVTLSTMATTSTVADNARESDAHRASAAFASLVPS